MNSVNPEYPLQLVFNAVHDALFVIDHKGFIQQANNAALDLFGYLPNELNGTTINLLMPDSIAAHHDGYLKESPANLESRIFGQFRELKAMRKNGTEFPIELSISRFTHNAGVYYIGTIRDISKQKELNRIRESFLSTVSHELRTPLSAVKGVLQLLRIQNCDMSESDRLEMLILGEENVVSLEKLVNDILDIQKLNTGSMTFKFLPTNVKTLVEKVSNKLQLLADPKKIVVAYKNNQECLIYADEFRIGQVITNLVSNAIKYDISSEPIKLEVEIVNNKLRISVIDSGPGINDDFIPRLFLQFSQAEDSLTRRNGGVGLGLFICQQIIDSHNGNIAYSVNPTGGSIFYFELPLHFA